MAEQLTREQIAAHADIHAAPVAARGPTIVDRTFELPAALYGTVVGLFLGFIAVMAVGFGNPELILPLVLFAFIIGAGFALPTVWTRLAPDAPAKAKSWGRFMHEGIMTNTGRTSARDASVQVLLLPVLIFVWGVVAVVIAALV